MSAPIFNRVDGDSALGEMIKRQRETVGLNRGASAGGTKDGPRGSFTDPRDNSPTLAEAGIDAAQRRGEVAGRSRMCVGDDNAPATAADLGQRLQSEASDDATHRRTGNARLRASGGLGEMIKRQRETVGLAKAGRPPIIGSVADPISARPTLAEAGIDAAQRLRLLASGWASSLRMADLPAGGRCASAGIWRAWADWCTP